MNAFDRKFIETGWDFYETAGRHALPWRIHVNPYSVLVSELMLQQTQVERVIPKYDAFMEAFPTVHDLARAPLSTVLILWQGLGYNRRAKYLHECARAIVNVHTGVWPRTHKALLALPGVGPYTASALLNFAFNEPHALIETNVRTVYLHHYFPTHTDVSDEQLWPIIERTVSVTRPRDWQYALMDYGSHLKRTVPNPNRRSRHHTKQSPFIGSRRQVRGAILDALRSAPALTFPRLKQALAQLPQATPHVLRDELEALTHEGLIIKMGTKWQLPHE